MASPMDTPWQLAPMEQGTYALQRYAVLEQGGIEHQDHGYQGRRYTLEQATAVLALEQLQGN